jgi:hypothetical protein
MLRKYQLGDGVRYISESATQRNAVSCSPLLFLILELEIFPDISYRNNAQFVPRGPK